MVMTASDPLVNSCMHDTVKMKMRKCTNLDKLCFDYFLMFKDCQTHEYENVQPLDEIHMGNGFFQPPVIGRSQVTRHAA